jgi:hypothetical protein
MRLFDTKKERTFDMNGVVVKVAGVVVGRLTTLTVAEPEELDRIADIVGMPHKFSMGCSVKAAVCPLCGEDWCEDGHEEA